jgi:cyclohexyl-isocyanide hydratase
MKLGIPVYEGVNLLDVTGPWEMFRWVDSSKKLETVLLSLDGGPVTTIKGFRFEVHASLPQLLPSTCFGFPEVRRRRWRR